MFSVARLVYVILCLSLIDAVLYGLLRLDSGKVDAQVATGLPDVGEAVPRGTVAQIQIPSTLLGGMRDANIYLPAGYDAPNRADKRYPTLYLLHGAPGGYDDWVASAGLQSTADELIADGILPPIIIVMPDGNYGELGDSQWVNGNAEAGFGHVEDFVIDELIPGIDARYRTLTDRQDRAIGGLSAGAYGAFNIFMHHPQLFGTVMAHSGFYRAQPTDDGTDLFAGDEAAQHANSPLEHLDEVQLLYQTGIYIDVGTSDPWFVDDSEELDEALTARHIAHVFNEFPGGHSWDYWTEHLADALTFLGTRLER